MYNVLSLHRLASNHSNDDDDDDDHLHHKGHVHLPKAYNIVQTVYSLSLTVVIIIIIVVIAVVRERTAQHACAKIARSKQHRTQELGTW